MVKTNANEKVQERLKKLAIQLDFPIPRKDEFLLTSQVPYTNIRKYYWFQLFKISYDILYQKMMWPRVSNRQLDLFFNLTSEGAFLNNLLKKLTKQELLEVNEEINLVIETKGRKPFSMVMGKDPLPTMVFSNKKAFRIDGNVLVVFFYCFLFFKKFYLPD